MSNAFASSTLLDYAIQRFAGFVRCGAGKNRIRPGWITFAENLETFVPADKKPTQMNKILEVLVPPADPIPGARI